MIEIHQLTPIIASHQPRLVALADEIWDHPELRWEEHTAVAAQVRLAEDEGFTVTRELAGIPTAFVAEAGSGGPVVALLGEYDALADLSQAAGVAEPQPAPGNVSGNGHGCGHHLLGAGSLLAAIAAKDYLAAHRLPGRVRYYGCPAEEGGGGKVFLVCRGAFDDVNAALAWHPGDTTQVNRNAVLATIHAYFRFTGRAAHAANAPHLGRSALDAVELMNVGVNYLREHMPDDARIHYAITDSGGRSPNVVQPRAETFYYVRHPELASAYQLYERVKKIAEGAAMMTETSWSVELESAYAEILPNDAIDHRLQHHLDSLGPIQFDDADLSAAAQFRATLSDLDLATSQRRRGITEPVTTPLHQGVLPLKTARTVGHFSTDVADVSQVTPTGQISSATWAFGTPGHSWRSVAQGKTSYAHKAMIHAATVLAASAIDLLNDQELLAAARAEHSQRSQESPYQRPFGPDVPPPPLRTGPPS